MKTDPSSIVLASSSPRRKELLGYVLKTFDIEAPSIDESPRSREKPLAYVKRMALEKAQSVAQKRLFSKDKKKIYILSCDTIVVQKGKIFGKPQDSNDALKTLQSLSKENHIVYTAYCWLALNGTNKTTKTIVSTISTKVTFSKRPKKFWEWYLKNESVMDKAGAYGAQGLGASFLSSFQGSYSNVVGLPLSDVLDTFSKTFGRSEFRSVFGFDVL